MSVRAVARYVRIAPDKVRQVATRLPGLDVAEADRVLALSRKDAAVQVRNTLGSAVANAEHNHDLDADELRVITAEVNEGPTLRRFRPRAMGRATRIDKRTSHVTVTVGTEAEVTARGRRRVKNR
jgi:large subunit ribosomal protein L22